MIASMRQYTAKQYENLVEHIEDDRLQAFMEQEQDFIRNVPDIGERSVVDLGAGHGRVVPMLASAAKDVVAIEINPEMFPELERRSSQYDNVVAILGDFNNLSELLGDRQLSRPLFLILQNSLGTVEGSYHQTLDAVSEAARASNGEILISFLRQQALADWGLSMYAKLESMVGTYDPEASDLGKGIFRTNTGYESKWWSDDDITGILGETGGHIQAEQASDYFRMLRISFA